MKESPVVALIAIAILTFGLSFGWLPQRAIAQKIDNSKVDKAAQRASLAAEILTGTPKLRGDTISRELLTRAKAIGVFPDFDRMSIVMPKTRISYGVISRRLPNGWSTPVYYGFGFREQEQLSARGSKKPDLIVLFMTDKAIETLLKGRVPLMKEMVGVAGPVGKLLPEKYNEANNTNVFVYSIIDGKVHGLAVDANDGGGILNPDNNLNEAIYGMKAQDVLAGKSSLSPAVVAAVSAYPNALTQLQKEK